MTTPVPVITLVTTPKSSTEIDFHGTLTGLVPGQAWSISATASQGWPQTFATEAATTLPAGSPPPTPTPTPTATAAPTPTPTPTPVPVTWASPSAMTLSADKLTATCPGGKVTALSSVPIPATPWYAKVKIVKGGPNWTVGIVNIAYSPTLGYLGLDNNSIGFYPDDRVAQSFWVNNKLIEYATGSITPAASADGDVVKIAGVGTKIFVQTPSMVAAFGPDSWNSLPKVSFSDPHTGAVDFAVLGSGNLWLAFNESDTGTAATLITDAASLADGPAGYMPLTSAAP